LAIACVAHQGVALSTRVRRSAGNIPARARSIPIRYRLSRTGDGCVGEPNTWRVRRVTAFALVVALHAGLFIILTFALRTSTRQPLSAGFITTLITLPSLPLPAINRPPPPISNESPPLSPVQPPIAPPSGFSARSGAGPSTDWAAEAERAARAAVAAPRTRSFGEMPTAPDWVHSAPTSPKHYAGEAYRLATGESIVWVNDRCFVVSEPPPLGTPDVFARAFSTRMGCQAPPGPREGELFKDLPAYKKYHPQ